MKERGEAEDKKGEERMAEGWWLGDEKKGDWWGGDEKERLCLA